MPCPSSRGYPRVSMSVWTNLSSLSVARSASTGSAGRAPTLLCPESALVSPALVAALRPRRLFLNLTISLSQGGVPSQPDTRSSTGLVRSNMSPGLSRRHPGSGVSRLPAALRFLPPALPVDGGRLRGFFLPAIERLASQRNHSGPMHALNTECRLKRELYSSTTDSHMQRPCRVATRAIE
jgi:hypothetical protein